MSEAFFVMDEESNGNLNVQEEGGDTGWRVDSDCTYH